MRGNLTSREQRLTESLITGLQELAEPERQPPKLSRSEPRGAIPSGRGYAESNYQPGTATSTGGGIASPLIEGEVPPPAPDSNPTQDMTAEPNLDRLYWPQGLKSSDGLFVLPSIKELVMRDANGAKVVILLADPDPEVAP
jgi:hypothetical protein